MSNASVQVGPTGELPNGKHLIRALLGGTFDADDLMKHDDPLVYRTATFGGNTIHEMTERILESMAGRDRWDHYVGGLTSGMPILQGLVAPTEKGRNDAMRSAASGLARTEDANPTQQQINMIYGQMYDPSSSTEENMKRIARFSAQKRQEAEAKQQAANLYKSTGYATMGSGGGMGTEPAPEDDSDEASDLDSAVETKEMNGQWYEKVPGGWKKIK